MVELPVVTKLLLAIGILGSLLAVAAVAMAVMELVRSKPSPHRNLATIVSSTGVILICLKWLVPLHSAELRNASYVGTAFFMIGAGIQVYLHRRSVARV